MESVTSIGHRNPKSDGKKWRERERESIVGKTKRASNERRIKRKERRKKQERSVGTERKKLTKKKKSAHQIFGENKVLGMSLKTLKIHL